MAFGNNDSLLHGVIAVFLLPRSNLLGKVIHIWDTGIAMTPDFITIKTLSSRDILKFLYMRLVM